MKLSQEGPPGIAEVTLRESHRSVIKAEDPSQPFVSGNGP